MTIASHQPDFFPYLGFFFNIHKVDLYLLSCDVPFTERGMHHYNYIKNANGKHRITLPVETGSGLLSEKRLQKNEFMENRLKEKIRQNYRRSKYFEKVWADIEDVFNQGFEYLVDFNEYSIKKIIRKLGITTHIERAPATGLKRDLRLIELCKIYGADTYLSGHGAAAYHDPLLYKENGVSLVYTDYKSAEYVQRFGTAFVDNLSVIDYLFNCGYKIPGGW